MDFLKWMIEEHPVWLFWFTFCGIIVAAALSNFTPIYVLREGDTHYASTPRLPSQDT